MPSPTQSNTPLARIQPVKQELASLEKMRADLHAIVLDKNEQPFVRMLAGIQRDIVDHLRLIVAGQRMQGQAIKKYIDDKTAALAAEVNAALASLTERQPEAEQPVASNVDPVVEVKPLAETMWQGPQVDGQAVAVEVAPQTATPPPTPSPNAPQMTVTPVARRRSTQQQPAAAKAGAK